MNDRHSAVHYRLVGATIVFVLFLTVCCVLPVAADDVGVFPAKSDVSNLAFANQATGYYFFKFDQVGGGGLNALHIASSSTTVPNYGDVSTTTSQSGTFYITETGGRGYQDDAILLVAVKGKIPGNFAIHIKSSGYSWTPTGERNHQPELSQITYHSGAVDTTFTNSQFVYGSQTWKPAGNNVPSDYPLYYGEDTTDTTNLWKLMFIDLKAGPIGPNGDIDVTTLTEKGAIKVDYTIENLDTVATFNTYAWNDNTTQGKGISWTNMLVGTGSSGYTVLGTDYSDRADEFPTIIGSTPVYHPPKTSFTANVTSGTAPLTVQFTDTTVQSVKTWYWDFGDKSTSTEPNPVHTYMTPGTYTVTLTATTGQGLSALKTQPGYITVSPGGSSSGSSGGVGSEIGRPGNSSVGNGVNFTADVTSGAPPLTVKFTDTSTIGNITNWAWDFTGDNIPDSFDQNPAFVFGKTGDYTVKLTVKTTEGMVFNFTLPDFIRVVDTSGASGDTWVFSDQSGTGTDSSGSDQQQTVDPARAATMTPAPQGTSGYSPLGTKVAEILLDMLIVVGVVGAGVILWKKL